MAKSDYKFSRWDAQSNRTWAFSLYGKYDDELTRIGSSHYTASKFIYKALGHSKAIWEDAPDVQFGFYDDEIERYNTIREWSDTYESFGNWVNLNSLLTLTSNFETYFAAILNLSLQSDPGIILGMSKSVDGAKLRKCGKTDILRINEIVTSCTKGDWSARIDTFEKFFGTSNELRQAHSDLELIRKIRNEIGHAFGRDIDQARAHGQIHQMPIRKLNHKQFRKHQKNIRNLVTLIDEQLMKNHIGEYEVIDFYSKQRDKHQHSSVNQRAIYLKKAVGKFGSQPRGKVFCQGLIKYWDKL